MGALVKGSISPEGDIPARSGARQLALQSEGLALFIGQRRAFVEGLVPAVVALILRSQCGVAKRESEGDRENMLQGDIVG